jgi:hypothetical protein
MDMNAANVQSISLTNDKTQEKLVIERIDPHPELIVRISRYPKGAKKEWIEESWKIIDDQSWIHCQERKILVDIKSEYFTSCSLI